MSRREVLEAVRLVWRSGPWLLVDKPAGLPTTAPPPRPGERAGRARCLVDVVRRQWRPRGLLHPTSRLDAPVSGLVLFATGSQAVQEALRWRREGRYRRLYVALAAGPRPSVGEGRWTAGIGLHPRDRRLRWLEGDPRLPVRAVKPAETRWARGPWAPQVDLGWLWLRPRTGRTHQLRVHAAAAGLPLGGDVAYGGPRRMVAPDGSSVTFGRVMLHCAALSVPLREAPPEVLRSEPPEVFSRAWRRLGGGEPPGVPEP